MTKCEDNTVPQVKFEFKHIEELSNVQKDEMCGELTYPSMI